MFEEIGFETATYLSFCTISWNIIFFWWLPLVFHNWKWEFSERRIWTISLFFSWRKLDEALLIEWLWFPVRNNQTHFVLHLFKRKFYQFFLLPGVQSFVWTFPVPDHWDEQAFYTNLNHGLTLGTYLSEDC